MSHTDQEKSGNEDIITSAIGNFGRWQLKISVLMALLKLPIAWFQLSIVFLAPPTQFWCKSPFNLTQDQWFKTAFENITLEREGLNTGYCRMQNNNTCIEYEYNRTIFRSSIISEWDLVCSNKRLVDVTQITLMLGVLIGNIFFGFFADKQGRKKTLIICIFLQSIFGIIAAWIPYFWGFVLARFLLAVANGGITVTSFVMCMEVVGGIYRTIVPILYQIPFGFGNSIMAGLAYYFRDWRDLQLALSLISSLYIFYVWLVPESPRWLMAAGRKDEAIKILHEATKVNKLDPKVIVHNSCRKSNNESKSLFGSKEIRKRIILLCVNWLIVGVTFYAFSQYLGKVAHNLHFTVAFSGFIALPGTLFCVYTISKTGRRITISCAHFLTALCFFGILATPHGVFPHDWPRVALAALGIIGLSVSMPALYLYTGELFPTVLRNAGVGISLMFCRLGSMLAPLVIALQDVSPMLPLLILGLLGMVETVMVLPLPETKGKCLPETVADLRHEKTRTDIEEINENYIAVPTKEPTEIK